MNLTFLFCYGPVLGLFLALLPARLLAAPISPNPIIAGNARFTVITPNCIRLEYAPTAQFTDAPSLLAASRAARDAGAQVTRSASTLTLRTSIIRLVYTPNGQAFSPANLHADIKRGKQTVIWTPGAPNPGNLGGTIQTLDGLRGPVDLGQGLLSRDGWFLLDDSQTLLLPGNSKLTTALDQTPPTDSWVQTRPAGSGTDWYLFGYGDNYRAALRSLAAVGGPVPLPRKYALGVWYSRYWPFSSGDYRQIVQEYGQHDFPLDNIVMDMDWHKDGWTGWSWNRKLLPDAEALLSWFHSQGLHVTLNLHPSGGVGPQEDRYADFMGAMGADPSTKQTLPLDVGSRKYTDALFSTVFAPLEKDGVDFWWLDWSEAPAWTNMLLYDRTAQSGQRGLSFSRWAGWGDHRHPIQFSGDTDTGFPMLAFEVPFTATAGNVGCFFWSHDIGGFQGGRNEESYTRWVQFGATSPVLRSHSTRDAQADRRPWNYPAWAENSMRISFHLRSELFPYLYSSVWETCRGTIPLNRPLYLDSPRDEHSYHNAHEYLLGDNLLAAPIVTAGVGPHKVAPQTVWFPAGMWYNQFTGERYPGKSEHLVAADITEFPLYVRGGVPVPMQPYQPRMGTARLTTLRVRCYPGEDGRTGTYTLYEDDGVTTAYEKGQSAKTLLSYTRRGDTVTVTVGKATGRYAGQPLHRLLILELPDTAPALKATTHGRRLAVAYDAASFTNLIALPAQSLGDTVTVTVQVSPAGWDRLHAQAERRRSLGLRDDQPEAALAVQGIGLVPKNESAYLYKGTVRDFFYAPRGIIDGDRIETGSGAVVPLPRSGEPLEVVGPPHTWHGRTVFVPPCVRFTIRGIPYHLPTVLPPSSELTTDSNVAGIAKVTASGVENSYEIGGATDGLIGGYPGDKQQEWSAGQTAGASLTLTWDTPQTVDRIALYDRPNLTDQITSGEITFSDGSTLPVGALPNDAKTPAELRFPPKTITSLAFKVMGVKAGTVSAGLAEIGVFQARNRPDGKFKLSRVFHRKH